jgi:class 3 adenylate cyclase/pimeloyl-ACP methyl ester carboxylesterase
MFGHSVLMSVQPETRYVRTADGLEIAYQCVGDGLRDIVLIPTTLAVDVVWDEPGYARALHRLAGVGRLIMLDYRGHGASDPVPLGALPTPEAWMDDLRAVLDAVGSESAHIVCHAASFLGLLFAATYPERTRTLTLIDPTARVMEGDGYRCGFASEIVEGFLEWDARTHGTPEHARLFAPSRVTDATFVRWVGRLERASDGRSVHAELSRWLMALDMRSVLPSIRTPTLVTCRADSPLVSVDQAKYVADNITGARFVELPGTDLLLFSQNADMLIDHIEEFITGVRPLHDVDRFLATVMFSDIVNSTKRLASVGDTAWRHLLDEFDQTVAGAVNDFQGRVVKQTGDGILATFDGPTRAVRCAAAVRDAATAKDLAVRTGLHAGEIQLRAADIAGIAVHIASRISALARSNEILVSRTVVDLTTGSGLQFQPRGEHQLKGVPDTWATYAVQ